MASPFFFYIGLLSGSNCKSNSKHIDQNKARSKVVYLAVQTTKGISPTVEKIKLHFDPDTDIKLYCFYTHGRDSGIMEI
jgi:hypothetical protein